MTITSSSALASPPGADRSIVQRALASPLTVLTLLRPWYWPVSLGPMVLGYVLGSGSWLPPAGTAGRHIGAALVLGPLVWGAVLAMNDRHDLAGDGANPRKTATPTVTGALGVRDLGHLQVFFATASIVVAAVTEAQLAMGTAGVLALGWAYSAPPRVPHWVPVLAGRTVPVWAAAGPGAVVAAILCISAVPMISEFAADGVLEGLISALILPFWLWGPLLALAVWGYVLHRHGSSQLVGVTG